MSTWCRDYGSLVHISRVHRSGIFYIRISISKVASSPSCVRGKMFSPRWYAYSWSRAGEKWGSFDPGVPCNEDGQISATQRCGEYVKEYFSFELFYNIWWYMTWPMQKLWTGSVILVEMYFSKYLPGIWKRINERESYRNWIT